MTDHEIIMEAAAYDPDTLRGGIMTLYNCSEIEVDGAGEVWIANPQPGHWLDDDGIARIARAIRAGNI